MRFVIQIQPMLRLNTVQFSCTDCILIIQIQPMLRLNMIHSKVFQLRIQDSNTTNVKVKYRFCFLPAIRLQHSNTTNVKVKFKPGMIFELQPGEFKYNQC